MSGSEVLWERACSALAWLVRQEYPEVYSLAEIAERWGWPHITPEQVEALRELEAQLNRDSASFTNDTK